MHLSKLCPIICMFSLLATLVMVTGCGSPVVENTVAENNKSNIQKIANSYYLYQLRKGKPVDSKEALIDFVENDTTIVKNLEFMKIERADFADRFISERDQQEFFVRWDVFVPARTAAQPLVFETGGVDGSYQVGFSDAHIEELSGKEYEKLKKRGVKQDVSSPDSEGVPNG